mmetsp:Transcript_32937/g.48759  ORF Transcript_32937/g.48759 Transcript_32937/m.48759 type:complete len:132 (-) Transcript_32937:577-972(-)
MGTSLPENLPVYTDVSSIDGTAGGTSRSEIIVNVGSGYARNGFFFCVNIKLVHPLLHQPVHPQLLRFEVFNFVEPCLQILTTTMSSTLRHGLLELPSLRSAQLTRVAWVANHETLDRDFALVEELIHKVFG